LELVERLLSYLLLVIGATLRSRWSVVVAVDKAKCFGPLGILLIIQEEVLSYHQVEEFLGIGYHRFGILVVRVRANYLDKFVWFDLPIKEIEQELLILLSLQDK